MQILLDFIDSSPLPLMLKSRQGRLEVEAQRDVGIDLTGEVAPTQ